VTATPAAPAPTMRILISLDLLLDHLQRVERGGQHDDRGAVLVVVKHRDVEFRLESRSISKQRGALMSSRLMPPKPVEIHFTALMIS
jgi:hypothetical protein